MRVRLRGCGCESGFFARLVASWFSACGLQRGRPLPASLLLISAGPVFFEGWFSRIGLQCVCVCVCFDLFDFCLLLSSLFVFGFSLIFHASSHDCSH